MKKTTILLLAAAAALLLVAEGRAATLSGCPAITGNSVIPGGTSRRTASQRRSGALTCTSVMPYTSMATPAGQTGGSLDCNPTALLNTARFAFNISGVKPGLGLTNAQNPFTQARCVFKGCGTACPSITVRLADALPVELMEFSVEGEGDEAPEDGDDG